MSDTMTEPTVDIDDTPAANTPEEKAPKPPKEPKPPVECSCRAFELVDPQDATGNSVFTTDCDRTTQRMFAQGHDARLVSFLVQGEFDGLKIHGTQEGTRYEYDGAAHAAGSLSAPLGDKAEKALARLQVAAQVKAAKQADRDRVREQKASEKAAKKAEADRVKAEKKAAADAAKPVKEPKDVKAKVQKDTVVDDGPRTDGLVTIKVGRGEYEATPSMVDNGEGGEKEVFTYRNLQGEEETRDADLVRVLRR